MGILYNMIASITFGVFNAAKMPANFVWLNLTTFQNQIMALLEGLMFFIGLNVVRKYALNVSWRILIICGSMLCIFFNVLYFLIIFDVIRSPWFYIFTDVSSTFMYTLNFLASVFCMVEVTEPNYETITYSLITTSSNAVTPLSAVVSYQFLALPLLPRQKKEARDLLETGGTSIFWGRFTYTCATVFLIYSTIVTFMTVFGSEYSCYKVLGGGGCSSDESSALVYTLILLVFLFCYGVNFYLSFWNQRFSFSNFV